MFSENERNRRLQELSNVMEKNDLKAVYLIGNSTVATNPFGCFRYFVDNRVFFYLSSVVFFSKQEPIAIVNNQMGKMNLVNHSFVHEAVINGDQLGGVVQVLKQHGIDTGRLGLELEILPATWMLRLQKELPGLELVDVSKQLFEIRTRKVAEEMENQRMCGKIADAGYQELCRVVKPGMLESELVALVDKKMQRMGADQTFMLIASGRFSVDDNNLSTLHNTASIDRRIGLGDSVAMEITPRFNGYWSQLVRTVSVGDYNHELDEFHSVIVGAIGAATKILKPGTRIGDLVDVMDKFIKERGYQLAMPCGHIAGIDLNEERLSSDNDRLLSRGMLVIIHPTVLVPQLSSGIFWGESYMITDESFERVMSSGDDLYFGNTQQRF